MTTIAALRARVRDARAAGRTIGLVPTMGALHEGHIANVRAAAERADTVVVSIFVNPTQFDRPDDLDAYPRDLAGDETRLAALGDATPALVFAPTVAEMYPRAPLTTVHVAGVTEAGEGRARPGHFDGVATVVTKLFGIVQPDLAAFGRKDAQQLRVVRRLVADLDLPVEIVPVPTVREADGIAMSSRNRRLSDDQRIGARALSRSLRAAIETARAERAAGRAATAQALVAAAAARLADAAGVVVDYVEAADPETFEVLAPDARPATAVVAVAAQVGPVRLIDNVEVGDLDDEDRLLAATD